MKSSGRKWTRIIALADLMVTNVGGGICVGRIDNRNRGMAGLLQSPLNVQLPAVTWRELCDTGFVPKGLAY